MGRKVSRTIRFDEDIDKAIIELSEMMGQSYSETVRDLVSLALSIMDAGGRITFRQLIAAILPELSKSKYWTLWRGGERGEDS